MGKLFSSCTDETELMKAWKKAVNTSNSIDELGYINRCYNEQLVKILNKEIIKDEADNSIGRCRV